LIKLLDSAVGTYIYIYINLVTENSRPRVTDEYYWKY